MQTRKRKTLKGKIDCDRSEKAPDVSVVNQTKQKIEVLEEYYNYDSMRLIPITNATLERLIDNGIQWARKNDDAIKINQFLDLNGISRDTWDKWRNKYQIAADGHKVILSILGNRRELAMARRKFDPGSTMRTMWIYDEEWARSDERWANLARKEAISSGGPQVIVLEKIPDSPLVPVRKEEKKDE